MPNQYGTTTVGNATAVLVLTANSLRKGCLINNNGTTTVYLGFDSSVSSTTGMPLIAGAIYMDSGLEDAWRGNIYAISGTGSNDVRYQEWDQ